MGQHKAKVLLLSHQTKGNMIIANFLLTFIILIIILHISKDVYGGKNQNSPSNCALKPCLMSLRLQQVAYTSLSIMQKKQVIWILRSSLKLFISLFLSANKWSKKFIQSSLHMILASSHNLDKWMVKFKPMGMQEKWRIWRLRIL